MAVRQQQHEDLLELHSSFIMKDSIGFNTDKSGEQVRVLV